MSGIKTIPFLFLTIISHLTAFNQPIPAELMAGHKYATVNVTFSRNFSITSKLGFIHMNTVQTDYNNTLYNSFILQDLLYFELVKNFRIAGGAAYSKAGFSPTAGIQYLYPGQNLLILFAPRINIENNP